MKEFIIVWIAIQLSFIGMVYGYILAKVHNADYECPAKSGKMSVLHSMLIGTVMPLAAFIPENPKITKYCENK